MCFAVKQSVPDEDIFGRDYENRAQNGGREERNIIGLMNILKDVC